MNNTNMIAMLIVLLVPSDAVVGQSRRLDDFAEIRTFRCDFTESEGRRTTAAGVTTSATRETFNDLVIDNVDYSKRTARFIGNAGSETVLVLDGSTTVSFIEEAPIGGNANLLSIFKRKGANGLFRAAFSRHTALTTGDLTISQSYGTCRGLI